MEEARVRRRQKKVAREEGKKYLAQFGIGESIDKFMKLATEGDTRAKNAISGILQECAQKKALLEELKAAGKAGNVAAMKILAKAYEDGTIGKPDSDDNSKKAVEWYKMASKAGDGDSSLALSWRYRDGKGCVKNINRAFSLACKGFRNGGAKGYALLLLADFYRNGLFAEPDFKKANELWMRSANLGSGAAAYLLGKSYLEGKGVPKDSGEAKRLFKIAAEGSALQYVKYAKNKLAGELANVEVKSGNISGVPGKSIPDSLPSFVLEDREKAKAGTLWDSEAGNNKEASSSEKTKREVAAERKRNEIARQKVEEERKQKERSETRQGCGCLLAILALICLVIWGPDWFSGNVVGDVLGKVRGWSWIALLWIWAMIVAIAKFAWHHWVVTGIVIAALVGKSLIWPNIEAIVMFLIRHWIISLIIVFIILGLIA